MLKKVFDDFYRVEGALTRSTIGTGIGLALVKKIVAVMTGCPGFDKTKKG